MIVRLIAFTDRGEELAKRLGEALPGTVMRCGGSLSLSEWTDRAFREAEGLVFVGAAAIAVRAVAPYLRGKTRDPAVVAVDEQGRYAIPLLSGHLGGANDLARRIGTLCGALPVITTATDLAGRFPVDQWARIQGCRVDHPERIKGISARILAGDTVTLHSDWPIAGEIPAQLRLEEPGEIRVSLRHAPPDVLGIVPKILVLGIGCKRGTARETIEQAVTALLEREKLSPLALALVCTIDRKADEPGLLAFCRERKLPLQTFSPEALAGAEGTFTASEFVKSVTGVDNVCERSAVLGSGGELLVQKTAEAGLTLAVAAMPFAPDWRWQEHG